VKSELGNSPGIINATGGRKATKKKPESTGSNFIFLIEPKRSPLTDSEMERLNKLTVQQKMKDLLTKMVSRDEFIFIRTTFRGDQVCLKAFSTLLIEYYTGGERFITWALNALEKNSVISRAEKNRWRKSIQDRLMSEIQGTTLEDDESPDASFLMTLKKNKAIDTKVIPAKGGLEKELLKAAYLDTPSQSRHKCGFIYKENGKFYIKLNLNVKEKI
jgi:hypothetical protein